MPVFLGHNDDLIMEKFKDIFPDPNIEAALIAMDDFVAMQTKAKQLVQIYKPAHSTNAAFCSDTGAYPHRLPRKRKEFPTEKQSASISPYKPAPRNNKTDQEGNLTMEKGVGDEAMTATTEDSGDMGIQIIDTKIKIEGEVEVKVKGSIMRIGDEVKRIFHEEDAGHGSIMIPITVTETIGSDIVRAKIIGNRGRRWDGNRGQNDGDGDGGRRWNQHEQYPPQEYSQNYPPPNHYWPPPMGCQYQYQIPYEQYPPYPQQPQQYTQRPPAQSRQATNICQLCQNQGHYDYQCQFAGDFMARTQKAFNQGRSYNHQEPTQGEWSNGENDNDDPHSQPFQ